MWCETTCVLSNAFPQEPVDINTQEKVEILHRAHHRDNIRRGRESDVLSFCCENTDALKMHFGGEKGKCHCELFYKNKETVVSKDGGR